MITRGFFFWFPFLAIARIKLNLLIKLIAPTLGYLNLALDHTGPGHLLFQTENRFYWSKMYLVMIEDEFTLDILAVSTVEL